MSVILGSEAVESGAVTRGQLRWNYRRLYRDVYVPKDAVLTRDDEIMAAWLGTGRRGIICGLAAAHLWFARRIPGDIPVDVIGTGIRRRPGLIPHRDRIEPDEIVECHSGMRYTTAARTALDLARSFPLEQAVVYLDGLASRNHLSIADMTPLLKRYKGSMDIDNARNALWMMDGGSRSARESAVRVWLLRAGIPRPTTHFVVGIMNDGCQTELPDFTVVSMAWEKQKVALTVDDDISEDRRAYWLSRHLRTLRRFGYQEIRVSPQHTSHVAVAQVQTALRERR